MPKQTVPQIRQAIQDRLDGKNVQIIRLTVYENDDGTVYGETVTLEASSSGQSIIVMVYRYSNTIHMWQFEKSALLGKADLEIAAGMLGLELVDPNGPPLQLEPPLTRTDDPRWDSDVCSEAGCHIIPNLIDEATGKTWCSKHVPSYTPVKSLKGDR